MKIHLETGANQNVIRSYQAGRIVVNQETFSRSVIVSPERITDWPPQQFEDLQQAHFELLTTIGAEVVLIGTGTRLRFPAPALTRALIVAKIGFEAMDTGAACRTYNVLMGEGRRVVAALLLEQ